MARQISGTLSSAVRMIVAARSSGRRSTSEPLPARPMGERAVATMTASGMSPGYRAVIIGIPRQLPVRDRAAPRSWGAEVGQIGYLSARPTSPADVGGVQRPTRRSGRLGERRQHNVGDAAFEAAIDVHPEAVPIRPDLMLAKHAQHLRSILDQTRRPRGQA